MMQRDDFLRQLWTATAFAGFLSPAIPASAQTLPHPDNGRFCFGEYLFEIVSLVYVVCSQYLTSSHFF
jgi:hypothetical protein